jgi:pantoate--beta-alanine ligase
MRTVRGVSELREALRDEPRPLGLVPTMGAFHDGHLSLIRRAREECATVVVSLFVNPTQFGPGEDFEAYPRDEQRDAGLAEAEGADFLFVPQIDDVYPPDHQTYVVMEGIATILEGAESHRGASHFKGVTTVVTKLFNMVGPDRAYFGQKDAQQVLVIRKLVRDLHMPVEIVVAPTVREPDGLALSSRNVYLSPPERERAVAISRSLAAAEAAVESGEREPERVLATARAVLDSAGIEPEYLELRSAEDLSPVERVNGSTLLAVAARVGPARLIDNVILTTNHSEVPS